MTGQHLLGIIGVLQKFVGWLGANHALKGLHPFYPRPATPSPDGVEIEYPVIEFNPLPGVHDVHPFVSHYLAGCCSRLLLATCPKRSCAFVARA